MYTISKFSLSKICESIQRRKTILITYSMSNILKQIIRYQWKYKGPSLYAVFLSAISCICDWKMAFFWNLSSNLPYLIYPWSFHMLIHYMWAYFWSPYLTHITRSTCILKGLQNLINIIFAKEDSKSKNVVFFWME
jgi:hypothetical protein